MKMKMKMKLINEKGKLFGLINLIDLLVLLAVLGAAAALIVRFVLPAADLSDPMETVVFTVRVRGLQGRVRPLINEGLARSRQYCTVEGQPIDGAFVRSVSFEAYIQQTATSAGEIVDAEVEDRWDAVFVLEAEVPRDAAPIMVDTQGIRIGINHTVRTADLEYIGSIETLRLEGEDV